MRPSEAEGVSGGRRVAAEPRSCGFLVLLLWSLGGCVLGGSEAEAAPRVGDSLPKLAVAEAPDGRVVRLQALGGKRVLVFYEHRDTAELNAPLKDELADLQHDRGFRRRVRVVAVADTSGYDFWPAKGFAKAAIRKKAQQYGLPIYCDWDGSFRQAFDFRSGSANVVVISPRGQVLFAREGKLSALEVQQVISLLLRNP